MASEPVQVGDLAVCVAINDNDRAWYEMLVPFILSLRQTDYRGHVVVIGFGLSQRKVDILREQAVTVVLSAETPLAVARYLEVARLCELNPGLRKAALYDADIWFCHRHHDLFGLIEGDSLFACRDPLFCDFITGGLIGPRREEHLALVSARVLGEFGGALQAGLVAGTAEAWRDFAAYIRDCIGRVGVDFSLGYGFDTTLLHLWAAQSRLRLLPETQNFVVKSGVSETRDGSGAALLACASGPIRGLHMTGDIRFLNCWRFYSHHRAYALTDGASFALTPDTREPLAEIPEPIHAAFAQVGFETVTVRAEAGATLHAFRDVDGLHVVGTGNHEIELRAADEIVRRILTVMYLSGSPAPIRARVRLGGEEMVVARDASQWISMRVPAGQVVTLVSESLPGQMGKVAWIVSDAVHLWQ